MALIPSVAPVSDAHIESIVDAAIADLPEAPVVSVNGDAGEVVLTQDDVADGSTAKQYTATEKTKLSGIATAATANDTDANLKNRANHTGTQDADTLTDGTTKKAFLATERTKLSGIATSATANDTDANLKARANHTGTQLTTTISDYRIVTARSQGAAGNGSTDDTTTIATAQTTAAALASANKRAVLALAPGDTHKISQNVASNTFSGGIRLDQHVSLDGQGAVLQLDNNSAFITNRWPTVSGNNSATHTLSTAITANVTVGMTQFTVTSTTGYTAGDDVFLRLNDNASDNVEVKDTFFAKVTSIDSSTLMTLDRPSPVACTVASQAAANKVIIKLQKVTDGGVIRDVTMIDPRTGSANAEAGIDLRYARNWTIENIVADHPGSGAVQLAYCENVTARNIRVRKSLQQGGQASKGRAISGWNLKNCTFEQVYAELFEGTAVFLESYCRGVVIDGLHLVNNYPGRSNSTVPLMIINQGSDVTIRNLILEGVGGAEVVSVGGTIDNNYTIENVWINTTSAVLDIDLHHVTGSLRIGSTAYLPLKTRTIPFRLIPSMSNVDITLPSGIYKSLKVFVTSTTGITNIYFVSDPTGNIYEFKASLSANTLVSIDNAGHYGSNYAVNSEPGHHLTIFTDGTVPAGTYAFAEVEYWPSAIDDGSDGQLQMRLGNPPAYTVTNLTTDRSYDADTVAVAELADIVGTLISDLKQSGWIA